MCIPNFKFLTETLQTERLKNNQSKKIGFYEKLHNKFTSSEFFFHTTFKMLKGCSIDFFPLQRLLHFVGEQINVCCVCFYTNKSFKKKKNNISLEKFPLHWLLCIAFPFLPPPIQTIQWRKLEQKKNYCTLTTAIYAKHIIAHVYDHNFSQFINAL